MPQVFSRFYAEVLFKHFDVDNSGTLQLAEVEEALKHLVKPNADGTKTMPPVACAPPIRAALAAPSLMPPHLNVRAVRLRRPGGVQEGWRGAPSLGMVLGHFFGDALRWPCF